MRGSSFGYLVKEGARSIYANRLMSVAAVGVLAACLMLIGSAALFSLNINQMVSFVEDQNEVVVFVRDDADQATIDAIDASLHMIANINQIEYVSREQGLEEQRDAFGEDAYLLDPLAEDNPLPNSFRISVDDLSLLPDTLAKIDAISGVDFSRAPEEMADTITGVKRAVYVAGSSVVIILAVVSLIIIANTIKVTVFNRRKEINIMKYVGATDSFIRLPFLVEGMLLGLISALLAFGIIWLTYDSIIDWLHSFSSAWIGGLLKNAIPFEVIGLRMLGAFSLAGMGIGMLGSMIFVRRYLKV